MDRSRHGVKAPRAGTPGGQVLPGRLQGGYGSWWSCRRTDTTRGSCRGDRTPDRLYVSGGTLTLYRQDQ
jgi:hypothetical protein